MSRERQLAALYTHSVFIGIKQQCGSAEAVTSMDTLRNYSRSLTMIQTNKCCSDMTPEDLNRTCS